MTEEKGLEQSEPTLELKGGLFAYPTPTPNTFLKGNFYTSKMSRIWGRGHLLSPRRKLSTKGRCSLGQNVPGKQKRGSRALIQIGTEDGRSQEEADQIPL